MIFPSYDDCNLLYDLLNFFFFLNFHFIKTVNEIISYLSDIQESAVVTEIEQTSTKTTHSSLPWKPFFT